MHHSHHQLSTGNLPYFCGVALETCASLELCAGKSVRESSCPIPRTKTNTWIVGRPSTKTSQSRRARVLADKRAKHGNHLPSWSNIGIKVHFDLAARIGPAFASHADDIAVECDFFERESIASTRNRISALSKAPLLGARMFIIRNNRTMKGSS